MPGSIKIDDGSGNYTILTNAGSLGSDKTITIPNTTGTLNLQSGSVLQVVTATLSTALETTSGTFADTGLTANITPSSTSSKVLVLVQHNTFATGTNIPVCWIQLLRDSTSIQQVYNVMKAGNYQSVVHNYLPIHMTIVDSPNTTSQITYKTEFKETSDGSAKVAADDFIDTMTLIEIGG